MKNIKKIGIIAPSDTVDLSKSIISIGIDFFRKRSIEVVFHEQCFKNENGLAGSVKDRVNAIEQFFMDNSIDLIMCFWGGESTHKILDSINYSLLRNFKKPIVGYSDCTALLSSISKFSNIITFTGPSFVTFTKPGDNTYSWNSLCNMISSFYNNRYNIEFNFPQHFHKDKFWENNINIRKKEQNDGPVFFTKYTGIGKALSINIHVLTSLIGTKHDPVTKDRIVFIEMSESYNENTFLELMNSLNQSKFFKRINGLVISKFMDCSNVKDVTIESILKKYISSKIPVLYNFDCGHTDPMFTIPNGATCNIKDGKMFFTS